MERGRIEGLPKCFEYPLLSQERIKLRTSNFVCTFSVSIGTKPFTNFGKSSRRTLETFQGTHILGASRGRLCDSKAFLSPFYRAMQRIVRLCDKMSSVRLYRSGTVIT